MVNRGWFKKGHDQRRHRFTNADCVAGFWAALESINARYPNTVGKRGHMSITFLTKSGRR